MKRSVLSNELPLMMLILSVVQICLILVQAAYSVLVYTGRLTPDSLYGGRYATLITVLVFVLNLIILRHVYSTIKRSYTLIHDQNETIKNIEALNNRIRAQRHDFLNHIQVLYGMLEVEAYDELRRYLQKLYDDTETANCFLKTAVLPVNALLQAKYSYAANRGITLQLDIGTRLENAPLSEWDMCRLLGNLLDNALYATERYEGEKLVRVRLTETLDAFLFIVINHSQPINQKQAARFFEPGFTTKKERGEGMGLYIVRQIAEAHRGTVTMENQADQITFTVAISKRFNETKGTKNA